MKNNEMTKGVFQTAFLSALIFAATSDFAMAQGVGNVVNNVGKDVQSPLLTAISVVSYIFAAGLGFSGLKGMKDHAENPSTKLAPQAAKIIVAGALAAGPSVLNALNKTTGLSGGGTTIGTFSGGGFN